MYIIGISAFYHDSAACIIKDGRIIAAVQEERFTRIKHDASFPKNSLIYCLKFAQVSIKNIDYIVFFEKPFLKFERIIETYLAIAPKGFTSFRKAIPIWVNEKLFQKKLIINHLERITKEKLDANKLLFSEHHMSHASSAFYPSPYKEACILTIDGVGEWASASLSIGSDNKIEIQKEIRFPHSLGLLYSAFTYYLGFKVNSGEYKVMGLAPYGEPKYKKIIFEKLLDLKTDGTFRLDMKYFNYCGGLTMTSPKFDTLFGQPRRKSEAMLTQFHMDIAASLQVVTEEVILRLTRSIKKETNYNNLCLSGGVALNCVANGKIWKDKQFDNIWVQPASGDAGGALGCALDAYYNYLNKPRYVNLNSSVKKDSMRGSYLGPSFSENEIETALDKNGAVFEKISDDKKFIDIVSDNLMNGFAVGWFQGAMEFGPRALGGRSILASPLKDDMQKKLNLKVKFRESFRPFAPAILENDVEQWFEFNDKSPYMLMVANLREKHKITLTKEQEKLFGIEKLNLKRSKVPAITHVDYSARIQTVGPNDNKIYYDLLKEFKKKTGCPILVNTSFNIRGEPIVNSPKDAFNCFMGTELDLLAIGPFILYKSKQNPNLLTDYKNKFSLD